MTNLEIVVTNIYRPREGAHMRQADAQIVGEQLEKIGTDLGHWPTAGEIVDAAKPKAAKLHRFFEWNDRSAALQYRLYQARVLSGSIEVKIEERRGDEVTARWMRAFHAIRVTTEEVPSADELEGDDARPADTASDTGLRFTPIRVIMQEPASLAQIVRNALSELRGWQERYRLYREAAEFQAALGPVIESIEAATAADGSRELTAV